MKICWDNLENLKFTRFENLYDSKNGNTYYFKECESCYREILARTKTRRFCKGCMHKGQRLNLSGKRFERLFVIEDIGKATSGDRLWKCLCDCGEHIDVAASLLNTNNTKSCGCLRKELTILLGINSAVDLTGKKFGRLTAVKRFREKSRHGRSPDGNVRWWWQCDCGVVKMIVGTQVTRKNAKTKSCGCINKERMEKSDPFKNYKGVLDNDLSLYDTYAHQLWDEETDFEFVKGLKLLKVKCANCEEWFSPGRGGVKSRIRYLKEQNTAECRLYCSDECKDACPVFGQYKYPKGKKPYAEQRERIDQADWRAMVLERDEYICVKCGSEENLIAHHIEGLNQNPVESLDIDLGITFCEKCHDKAHSDIGCRRVDLRRDMLCKGEGS